MVLPLPLYCREESAARRERNAVREARRHSAAAAAAAAAAAKVPATPMPDLKEEGGEGEAWPWFVVIERTQIPISVVPSVGRGGSHSAGDCAGGSGKVDLSRGTASSGGNGGEVENAGSASVGEGYTSGSSSSGELGNEEAAGAAGAAGEDAAPSVPPAPLVLAAASAALLTEGELDELKLQADDAQRQRRTEEAERLYSR